MWGQPPSAVRFLRNPDETQPAKSGRGGSRRPVAHTTQRGRGVEENRLGHHGSLAPEGIHFRSNPPGQVSNLYQRGLGRGRTRREKVVPLGLRSAQPFRWLQFRGVPCPCRASCDRAGILTFARRAENSARHAQVEISCWFAIPGVGWFVTKNRQFSPL